MLRRGYDHGRWVTRHHPGKDGRVDDEQVIHAVDLGVRVDDGTAAALAPVVQAYLGRSDPVVRTTG
jgi:hypothetical protein